MQESLENCGLLAAGRNGGEAEPAGAKPAPVEVIHPDAGDFVGRDPFIFAQLQTVNINGNIHGDFILPAADTCDRVESQIQRLRGRIARSVPVEQMLTYLAKLRQPDTLSGKVGTGALSRAFARFARRAKPANPFLDMDPRDPDEILRELRDIESSFAPNLAAAAHEDLLRRLNAIIDRANGRIAKLDFQFSSALYPALSSRESVLNMLSKIGHEDLREEARVHLGLIKELQEELAKLRPSANGLDILGDEAQSAIGAMTDIAERLIVVQRLVHADLRRRRLTVAFVIGYIGVAMGLTALVALRSRLPEASVPLHDLRLPLIRVPWPVVLWSLIGSFASMIHRFNRRPIYDFGDAVKWLLTRPVQGLVLGAAFYLVLTSGLLLVSGSGGGAAGAAVADEVVLVLAFLVGFSDRFADKVFSALVRRYSDAAAADEQGPRATAGSGRA